MNSVEAKSIALGSLIQTGTCQVVVTSGKLPHLWWRYRIRNAIKHHIYFFYLRHGYRHVQRLLHRFNLHYAPPRPTLDTPVDPGVRDHWCQWCGLRGKTYHHTTIAPLDPA